MINWQVIGQLFSAGAILLLGPVVVGLVAAQKGEL